MPAEIVDRLSIHVAEALPFTGAEVSAHLRRCFCPPVSVAAIEQIQQPMYAISADKVFNEEVCRVVFPLRLVQLDRLISDSLLYPEALGVDVPQLTQSLASADANGGRAIGPHPYR